ncbi:hypothetical protein BTJ45_03267 [Bacillus mycoides]|nr:hypothetical protein BTJ45_03267 [Bacillus mycoides]
MKITNKILSDFAKVNAGLHVRNYYELTLLSEDKPEGISHEQVCVLVARDRTKATVSKIACMGRVVKTKIDSMIGSK